MIIDNMIGRIICKCLAVAVILLFIGLAIQPSVAIEPETEIDIEPKDYLFQTIIDITYNLDIRNLLAKNIHNLFISNYNSRNLFLPLLFEKPRLLFSMLFTKPSMTYDYLNNCYNQGIKITNFLGEDKALEIIDSIKFNNIKIFNNLNIVIKNDKELFSRIASIQEMNKELKSNSPFKGDPLICYITLIFLFPILLLVELTEMNNIIGWIFALITSPFMIFLDIIGLVLYALGENLGCW
jgi:hypothetical protein